MKISYLHNEGILFIDYSGIITIENGISNIDLIEKEIRNRSLNTIKIRILFDTRETIWDSIETHNALSVIARKKFDSQNTGLTIYTAILNSKLNGQTFENEQWFCNKSDAVKWLVEKT